METLVTGSIAYDYLMRFPGSFQQHFLPDRLHDLSLSFLVDDMTKHWGGVGANIAFTLAQFGARPKLMGTVGRDFGDYRRWLEGSGVDCSTVIQIDEVFTASFFANTDDDNNQLAFFYGGAMNLARDYRIADVVRQSPDLVIISPNDPVAMVNLCDECRQQNLRFIYDPGQQVARLDGDELKRGIRGAYMVIVNIYEASVIYDKTGWSLDDLRQQAEIVVITESENGSKIYHDDDIIELQAFPPTNIADPTGAGDAYRAGFILGLSERLPLKLCGQIGALSATYALEVVGTQNHRFGLAEFVERFRSLVADGGQLDYLLKLA
ncbi:MAG: carbohydrate kinase family protein [Chloroflexota bacterium]|nr:carbohydrate kinase family protein [Chloroflexota bacterium]MDE2909272.1 carbohydrate kinase family protein [Chloroflexota bacterium]